MLKDLAQVLIPFSSGLKINVNDQVDDQCILVVDLPVEPYMAYGDHQGRQNASIEISVFHDHANSIKIINDIFYGISREELETDDYVFRFSYPDNTPTSREIQKGRIWQYYFTVDCLTIKK